MYCKNCGKTIDNDSIYCNHCGKKQSINRPGDNQKPEPILKENKTLLKTIKEQKLEVSNEYNNIKADHSYRKEIEATVVGVVIVIGHLILYNVEYKLTEFVIYTLLIGALFLRIAVTIWVVRIAKRQQRNTVFWGLLALFFPPLALIIIGLFRKKTKSSIDTSQKSNKKKSNSQMQNIIQLSKLKAELQPDEIILMNKKDWSYYIMKQTEWNKSKENGFGEYYIEVSSSE